MAGKQKPTHCMLDFETLDTVPNSVILSIGAVLFTEDGITHKFYTNVATNSPTNCVRSISESTQIWWNNQSAAAKQALQVPTPVPLRDALVQLAAFRSVSPNSPKLWGNGADFDNAILRDAYHHCQLKFPFGPYQGRCYRTIKNLPGMPPMQERGIKHNALDDSIAQAMHLIEMAKILPGLLD